MIGRSKEIEQLNDAYDYDESCFVAVYGRRRIGKTYLVNETFKGRFTFTFSGLADGDLKIELKAFANRLKEYGLAFDTYPKDWIEAFELLCQLIDKSTAKKKVIFLDELSWIDTPRSKFVPCLEYFWNGWCTFRKDVLLIVSSSSSSWMLNKIVHNRGGLYNRLRYRFELGPFSLSECQEFTKSIGANYSKQEILKLYMALGGVPFYWTYIKKELSADQNIDYLFFGDSAPLKDEFDHLFSSLFRNYRKHLSIIEALYKRKSGYTRKDIETVTGFKDKTLTTLLDELESCRFIRSYRKYKNRKKECLYQLVDNFVLFYYKFLEEDKEEGFWLKNLNTSLINSWRGLAFELVVLEHIDKVKESLGISGISTQTYSYRCTKDDELGIHGSQIDLLLDRADGIINIIEVKYSLSPYSLSKKEFEQIHYRVYDFIAKENIKRAVWVVLVASSGMKMNAYSSVAVKIVTGDDLF